MISNVGILLFNDVEVLDFAGPFEVFSVTHVPGEENSTPSPGFLTSLISADGKPVMTRGGMTVGAHHSFENCPELDILVIPGGQGTRQEVHNAALLAWIAETASRSKYVTSVCTGSFLLAEAGLLGGKRATTHWLSLQRLRDSFPSIDVDYQSHVVKDGTVFTSAGISAGIEMALLVVAEYLGESIARNTARHMEYRYPESNERRVVLDA